jgi:hypothetical protein
MLMPKDAVIASEKLQRYLLVRRAWDDKSKYLGTAGFTLSNPDLLETAIRQLATSVESRQDGFNEYGIFWRTEGHLLGPIAELPVVLIWLQWGLDGSTHFVTLKPKKG